MTASTRMLPILDDENRFFWTAGEDNVLRMQQCTNCQHIIHPYAPICPECQSREVSPTDLSGLGTVATFTINMQAWSATMQVPFIVAIVALKEQAGLNLTSNIINCAAEDVSIGMPVKVVFEQHEDVWLPLFEPA